MSTDSDERTDVFVDEIGRPPMPGFFGELEPGRRGEILDAAAGVFSEKGYDNGSMRDIAARVGVSEPAIYRHFDGKQALFLAFIRTAAKRLRTEAFALIDSAGADGIEDHLKAAFRDRRRKLRLYGPVLRTVLAAVAYHPSFLKAYSDEIVDPIRTRLTTKAAEVDAALGIADGAATRDARVRAAMALFVGYFVTSVVMADESDDAIASAFLRVMGWEPRSDKL